jgi:hypothetical protein
VYWLFGRLSRRPLEDRKDSEGERLQKSARVDIKAFDPIRSLSASFKRRVEWCSTSRAFGIRDRQQRDALYLAPRKIEKVRSLARAILQQSAKGRRWVDAAKLRSFLGLCVSLTLAFPFARFYSRSMYEDLRPGHRLYQKAARGGKRVRISHQSGRDLLTWLHLAEEDSTGRPILPLPTDGIMHTDAAEVGYGGTLDYSGVPGQDGRWRESKGSGPGRIETNLFQFESYARCDYCSKERWEKRAERRA